MLLKIINLDNKKIFEVYKISGDDDIWYWVWSEYDRKFLWVEHNENIKKYRENIIY